MAHYASAIDLVLGDVIETTYGVDTVHAVYPSGDEPATMTRISLMSGLSIVRYNATPIKVHRNVVNNDDGTTNDDHALLSLPSELPVPMCICYPYARSNPRCNAHR